MRRFTTQAGIECVLDKVDMDVRIGHVEKRAIISLKVSKNEADNVVARLSLAPPLRVRGTDPQSLWLGPDHWLIVSTLQSADAIIGLCHKRLAGILHIAVDYVGALAILKLHGSGARALLAAGSALDFRPAFFPTGSCCRTRLAQIAAVVVATAADEFEIFVDRSYGTYLSAWLSDSMDIAAHVADGQA
jgi:sarcosine oxidase subunit gamma